jgi:Tol biopolymer transport system component
MDELHDRFHRLDRIASPDLWPEAVGRAAALDAARRRGFNPAMVLLAAVLLMAALAGTIAVGGWVNRPEVEPLSVRYSNGVVAAVGACGRIVGIDPDTAVVSELVTTSNDAECYDVMDLAWSSDGRWLAYSVPGAVTDGFGRTSEVWVRDTRSGSETLVQSCDGCWNIDISPDGSLVTYVDYAGDGGLELSVARTDGSSIHRVPFLGSPGLPAFSPDGEAIAIPLTGGTSGIHVLDVSSLENTATPTMWVVHGPVASSQVSWSPDGEWLAFDKLANDGFSEIWAVRRYGTDARLLASGPNRELLANLTWSADSSSVAYVSNAPPSSGDAWMVEIRTATLDGETNRVYSSSCCPLNFASPTWSPDGEWIAFGIETDEASESGMYLVRPDGSDLRRLSPFAGQPAWQPLIEDQ